jgi:hypothetical protein
MYWLQAVHEYFYAVVSVIQRLLMSDSTYCRYVSKKNCQYWNYEQPCCMFKKLHTVLKSIFGEKCQFFELLDHNSLKKETVQ